MGLSLSTGLRGPAAPTPTPKKPKRSTATPAAGEAKPRPPARIPAKPITAEPAASPCSVDRLAPPRLPVEGTNTERPIEHSHSPEVTAALNAFDIKQVRWDFLAEGRDERNELCQGWICRLYDLTHTTGGRTDAKGWSRCVDCIAMEAWRDLRSAEWVKPTNQIVRKLDRKWEKSAFGMQCCASGGPANGLLIAMSEETPYKDVENKVIDKDLRVPRWVPCDHKGTLWWQLPYLAETPADLPILAGLYEWVGTTYAWIGFGTTVAATPAEDEGPDE